MQAPQDNLAYIIGKRLISHDFPLVGAAIVLFWLEGIPPTAWIQLVRISLQWNMNGVQREALLLPYCLLIVQSVLLIVAWGIFFWTVYHEAIILVNLFTQYKPQAVKQSLTLAPHTSLPKEMATSKALSSSSNKASQSMSFVRAMPNGNRQSASAPIPQVLSSPTSSRVDFPSNPFVVEVEQPTTGTVPGPAPLDVRSSIELNVDEAIQEPPIKGTYMPQATESATKDDLPKLFEESEEGRTYFAAKLSHKKQAIEASTEKQQSEPFNTSSMSRLEELLSQSTKQGSSIGKTESNHELERELPQVSQAPEYTDRSHTRPVGAQSDSIGSFPIKGEIQEQEETQNADPDYVYGNPFEGALPDIFHYDMGLKRMLRTQLEQNEPGSSKSQQ